MCWRQFTIFLQQKFNDAYKLDIQVCSKDNFAASSILFIHSSHSLTLLTASLYNSLNRKLSYVVHLIASCSDLVTSWKATQRKTSKLLKEKASQRKLENFFSKKNFQVSSWFVLFCSNQQNHAHKLFNCWSNQIQYRINNQGEILDIYQVPFISLGGEKVKIILLGLQILLLKLEISQHLG